MALIRKEFTVRIFNDVIVRVCILVTILEEQIGVENFEVIEIFICQKFWQVDVRRANGFPLLALPVVRLPRYPEHPLLLERVSCAEP